MNPIVGIGELLWDIYPGGSKVAGGAPFNFAFHCHQLGHPAVIVSRVGADELGRELRDEVRRLGLSDEFIQTDHEHPTGTVRVALDENKVPTYTITEDVAWDYIGEEGSPVDEGFAHDVAAVCFGTLALRSPTSCNTILDFAGPGPEMPAALRVFDINLRQQWFSQHLVEAVLRVADWVKLSEEELPTLTGLLDLYWGDDEGQSALFDLQDRYSEANFDSPRNLTVVCLTRGGSGYRVIPYLGCSETVDEPGVPAHAVDTVGAGDAFTAAMVCLHLEGRPLRECARFANHYAARICEHQGATPRLDRAEVERAAFGSL